MAKTFKDFITKDKTVTGGTVQNDPPALTSNSPAIQKTPLIVIFLALGLGFTLSACGTNSLFEGASTAKAGDGKIPVQVVASAGATGNTDSSTVNYDGGVKVVFGLGVTPAERSDIITRAKTLGVPVIAASDASLGRAAHFHFGHKLSKEKRDAFKHRFGL